MRSFGSKFVEREMSGVECAWGRSFVLVIKHFDLQLVRAILDCYWMECVENYKCFQLSRRSFVYLQSFLQISFVDIHLIECTINIIK